MTKAINLKQLAKTSIGAADTAIKAVDTIVTTSESFLNRIRERSEEKSKAWNLQGRLNYKAELYEELSAEHKQIVERIVENGLEESVSSLMRGESLSFEFTSKSK